MRAISEPPAVCGAPGALDGAAPSLELHLSPAPTAGDHGTARTGLRLPATGQTDQPLRLVAALAAVLYRYTAEAEFTLVAHDAHGRQWPCPVDLREDAGFASLMTRIAVSVDATAMDGLMLEVADLQLSLAHVGADWRLECAYRRDRHADAAIEVLLRHLRRLLEAGSADGRVPIAWLPMFEPAERAALLAAGNDTDRDYPQQATVVDLFRLQARLHPDALALIDAQRRLRYRDVERAVDALAERLKRQGIGAGDRVAVCLGRSVDLPIALLAVLATGAAYVPLDPRYPPLRLQQMLDNAEPARVLSERVLRTMPPLASQHLLLIDDPAADGEAGVARPVSTARADAPAYLIYTSGSTGLPKGVQVPHRALCNLLCTLHAALGIVARDRLLAVSTVSFDIAVLELFLPLVVGASVVIAAEVDVVDGAALRRLLAQQRITAMQATPVSWQLLLHAGWQSTPGFRMLCGGEALLRPLAKRLLAGGGALWNLYGPTETTVWSSLLRVESGHGPLPIGPPIANTRFHVLDAHGEPMPAGQAGELYIGGDGVAQGYRNLPVLTARHFVANHLDAGQRGTLYRTGDRVRRRPDGCFDFLGRIDRQIKLRGYRIEPGDLEAALLIWPRVRECVAVVGLDAQGQPALLAYVAVDPDGELRFDVAGLQAALRVQLPAYLCPAVILLVDRLPRLANGKIDRAQLPVPVAVAPQARDGGSPAQRLARHWHAVLGAGPDPEVVDADAHFFEAGGHSLLAADLLGRIEREFGVRLSMAALIAQPTFAGLLALLLTGRERAHDFSRVVQLQVGDQAAPLIALNNTGIYFGLSRGLGPQQPFLSLQLFDPDQPMDAPPCRLAEIATAYVALIREQQPAGPYHLIGWCVAGVLAHEVARQLLAGGERVAQLILIDSWAPDYRRRLPWWRAQLAGWAFRWHPIARDARQVRAGRLSVRQFLARRRSVQSLSRLLPRRERPMPVSAAGREHEHDQWLLRHLEAAAEVFEPGCVPGRMLLLRSSEEPAGRCLDAQMGWGAHVAGEIRVVVIDGSHFGIFQPPAVIEMAAAIREHAR